MEDDSIRNCILTKSGERVKYYYREHLSGYERVKSEGKISWGEIQGESGFENFAARRLLEFALPRRQFKSVKPRTLEYGCL